MKLSDLKVGDKVCCEVGSDFRRRTTILQVGPVEKITATQITALGARWMIRTGNRVGDGAWSRDSLMIWTPELQAEADQAKAEQTARYDCRLAADNLRRLEGADALRIAALLPPELLQGSLK